MQIKARLTCAVGEEKLEDVGTVVTDGRAERCVDAILFGVGVYSEFKQHTHGFYVVDRCRQLHDTRGFLGVCTACEKDFKNAMKSRCWPEPVCEMLAFRLQRFHEFIR